MPGRNLLLAGAGHAHLDVIAAIGKIGGKGHSVTVVSPGEKHYYSGMGPGMLAGVYRPEQIRFPVRRMVESRGATFITDRVVYIDAPGRYVILESGRRLLYDVLSCNVGSGVSQKIPVVFGKDVFSVKPIENLYAARQRILAMAAGKRVRVGVCGGGPAGVEIAGNALAAGTGKKGAGCRVQLFSAGPILKSMPEKVRRLAKNHLAAKGLEIVSGSAVLSVEADESRESGAVRLENGDVYSQDIVLLATGVHPPGLFSDSGLTVSTDGGLLVNRFLQSPDHPEIFGGGDCISFAPRPLAKVGVYPVRQGPVLLSNLRARLNGGRLLSFDPGGGYLVVLNLGGGYGIFSKGPLHFGGKTAFVIKDFIDRKFMRKYRQ